MHRRLMNKSIREIGGFESHRWVSVDKSFSLEITGEISKHSIQTLLILTTLNELFSNMGHALSFTGFNLGKNNFRGRRGHSRLNCTLTLCRRAQTQIKVPVPLSTGRNLLWRATGLENPVH